MKTISALAIALAAALSAATAGNSQTTDPCIKAGETPVVMKAADGATVYGVEVGTGTTGVVLGHQYFSNHCEFMDFARELAAAGFRATRIKLVGASMGGTAVLVAASEITPPVDGVVSLSGPTYFRGLNAVRAVRRSRIPVRFLVTRGERRFAPDATYLMRAAVAKDKAILRVSNGGHGSSMLTVPAAKAFVLAFL